MTDSHFLRGFYWLFFIITDCMQITNCGLELSGRTSPVRILPTYSWCGKGQSERRRGQKKETQGNLTGIPLPSRTTFSEKLEIWVHFKWKTASVRVSSYLQDRRPLHCFKVRQCYMLLVGWACSNYMPPWLLFYRLIRTIFKTFVDHSSRTLLYVSKSTMIYPWNYWLGTASFFHCMFSLAYNFN